MRLSFVLLFFSLIPWVPVYAQITDQFSDGNFTANPTWTGNSTHFVVNTDHQLQLNAPEAGNSMLWVQGNIPDSCIWALKVRLAFAPSSGNQLKIWLQATSPETSADGYYLEIGENGSNDALKMYKQQGGSSSLLATGSPGAVASDPVDATLKVKRDAQGNWQVWLNDTPEFTLANSDMMGENALWFGFQCTYTATRTDKFFFDDIDIQPDVPDQTPPVLQSVIAAGSQSVRLFFNEPLDSTSAVQTQQYLLDGAEHPSSAVWVANQPTEVLLSFGTPWQNGITYTISAEGVQDAVGNPSGTQQTTFSTVVTTPSGPFDIVINEIMADPSPAVGLPDNAEWIELYNRSDKLIQLSELRIQDNGGTPRPLPAYLLSPGAWVVVSSSTSAATLMSLSVPLIGMADFPSLNNDSETLILSDLNGTTIDQVKFDLSWHTNNEKRDGGWSLERINPDLICLGKENWQSCPQLPGGSPGRQNYAFNTLGDNTAPFVLAAVATDAHHIRLDFSEGMDLGIVQAGLYQFQPSLPVSAATLSEQRNSIMLQLQEAMQGGILYQLLPEAALTDCSGNAVLGNDSIFVGLSETPATGDIIINEILFNPAAGGSRFVEVYNRSNKIIKWEGFLLAASENGDGAQAISHDRLLIPGDYAVFAPNPVDVQQRFTGVRPGKILMQSLPPIDDRSGNLSLFWSNGQDFTLLDAVNYSNEMHNALLSATDQEGSSLERIRTSGPSDHAANWTSSARQGTPTLPNSQTTANATTDNEFSLSSAVLSPDGDGYEDFLDIVYQLPGGGYAAAITIFDSNGAPVKHLARQELIGTSGALRWDGDRDDGSTARPGIYILWVQMWQPQGNSKEIALPFALTNRW